MNNDLYNDEKLNLIANIFQILDLALNLSQTSNDELMKHLQQQDKMLSEQTNKYLKEILNKLNEINGKLTE